MKLKPTTEEETERAMYPDLDMSFINLGIHLFSF